MLKVPYPNLGIVSLWNSKKINKRTQTHYNVFTINCKSFLSHLVDVISVVFEGRTNYENDCVFIKGHGVKEQTFLGLPDSYEHVRYLENVKPLRCLQNRAWSFPIVCLSTDSSHINVSIFKLCKIVYYL